MRTKIFKERMATILQRCEELCNVTGCWLYMSAQLATSNHGFVHFASDALVRDVDTRMNDVHALHSNMYSALCKATIRDVAQAEMETAQVRSQLAQAKAAEAAAVDNAAALQKQLDAREEMMAKLRSMLTDVGFNLSDLASR
ncbi:hypothetical protein MPER_09968 [Moniliophthora perniciosa FA553]|nr:hypothetical protein MPER_09968 [Moniliophthora perniciosa FA553]